jgi:hypothetical protein
VALSNLEGYSSPVTVTITVYDSDDVPIYACLNTVENPSTTTSTSTTFTIPTWAFVGKATVYVNILTNNPLDGGVPICPQLTANFQITS